MPLDRRIELRIFDDIADVPRGSPATVANVWADRQFRASVERIQESLASTGGTLFVDYRIRWRADVESIIPGLLIVRDEAGNDYEVSGVATDDQRRSYLTIQCSVGRVQQIEPCRAITTSL